MPEALIWIVFASFVVAPILAAAMLGLLGRGMNRRRDAIAEWHNRGMAQRPPATLRDLSRMSEFDRRHRRCLVWCWSGWIVGAVMVALSLPLSGIAIATLTSIWARRAHLRCPECDTSPGFRGLEWGWGCRGCGAKLRP